MWMLGAIKSCDAQKTLFADLLFLCDLVQRMASFSHAVLALSLNLYRILVELILKEIVQNSIVLFSGFPRCAMLYSNK